MVAKIGRGNNLYGALAYNQQKVDKENGKILFTNRMIETKDGNYTVRQLAKSFEPYLLANRNTEKTTLHISLNPDPRDQVSDEKFIQMAQDYMNEMGYGNQPFVVFKHTDISRPHTAKFPDWSDRDDIKAQLKMEIIVKLHQYGYPPITQDEVYKNVLEQAENFKRNR